MAVAAHSQSDPSLLTADPVVIDPTVSAKLAGLRYTSDAEPGISRKPARRSRTEAKHRFTYVDPAGKPVRDQATLTRIRALAIPPAWTDVWISPISDGHIQATGRDHRGRKQYRYHPRWREVRDETKYHRMLAFGQALPRIREQVNDDLSLPGLPRKKVLATLVRLLEATLIRVGNEAYARDNKSYGLTTMRNRHVAIDGSTLQFHFKGKSGVRHDIDVRDRRLAGVVKRLRDLPGQHLFQYFDADGTLQEVTSDHVNEYLRDITGQEFSAKDFRTWAGTVLAAQALTAFESAESDRQAKKNVVQAIEAVAQRLGNTVAVCRKCYIHPEIINAYLEGSTICTLQAAVAEEIDQRQASPSALPEAEAAVLELLRQRLASA